MVDATSMHEAFDRFLHGDHAVGATGEDIVVDAFEFSGADGRGDGGGVGHDFEGEFLFFAFDAAGEEPLADDEFEDGGELCADFVLGVGGEKIDEA